MIQSEQHGDQLLKRASIFPIMGVRSVRHPRRNGGECNLPLMFSNLDSRCHLLHHLLLRLLGWLVEEDGGWMV